ncbi:MAG: TonB-dependent receptor [Saprospiraceae bacterium]|nr:TonB-dependent receptor [Saprospiraceae bacterium]MBP7699390.1 TonB-dependent receptor [Saprospiraceae bacterium]
MKTILLVMLIVPFFYPLYGQNDTLLYEELLPITIKATRTPVDIQSLEPVRGTYIFAGKKTEVVRLTQKSVAISEKYARQIFAKIPGIFVYDMDGTGNQMNISTRGLDPHRGWEFNIRKDGIITNSDMYGYPASHYNIPMEAVERIELTRGTGSLQYGAQFGGMLNYVSKQPDTTKQLSFESINTVGSYGLVSTYNAASGKIGKFRYSAWANKKWIGGYRKNSDSRFNAENISLFYDIQPSLLLKMEWTHSNYVTHLPGALNDSMFLADPRTSTRSRNYYSPNIHIPSLALQWSITPNTKLELNSSAVLGTRNSVMFDKPVNVGDTINLATLTYNNRQVDIDNFNSYTTELRFLHSYALMNQQSTLTAGVQFMNNDLHRRQLGKGTTGSDYDLTLVAEGWGRDLHFKTHNMAFFVENRWAITDKFSVNTGVRLEAGKSKMSGSTIYYTDQDLPNTIRHRYPLFGVSTQYDITKKMNVYAGWSHAYRPVIFKDIIPSSVYEYVDKDLKDAFGYNAEIGFRGKWHFLSWDITGFYLQYSNRLGTLAQTDSAGNLTIFRTNIGNTATKGVECLLQGNFDMTDAVHLSVFTSTSYMDARYQDAAIRVGTANVNIGGNKVESVPEWICRNGVTLRYARYGCSLLYSFTAKSFADALNTTTPSPTGAVGLVPAYNLLDINISARISNKIKLQLNINNALDEHYFTKRPQFYPGPGIWSSDGRTISGTVSIKI